MQGRFCRAGYFSYGMIGVSNVLSVLSDENDVARTFTFIDSNHFSNEGKFHAALRTFASHTWSVSGCRSAQRERNRGEENPLPSMTLTEADKGKSITARPGDTIAISLPENPSTASDGHWKRVATRIWNWWIRLTLPRRVLPREVSAGMCGISKSGKQAMFAWR